MKKITAILILVSMLVGITSCSKTPVTESSQDSSAGGTASAVSGMESAAGETSDEVPLESNADPASIASGNNNSKTQSQSTSSKNTSSKPQEVNYKLKVSDYILDESVSAPRYLNKGFEAYTDFGRNGSNEYMSSTLVQKSIEKLKLGSPYYSAFDGVKSVAGEWGYTFLNLDGMWDGSGLKIEGAGWKNYKPTSDKDALAYIKNWMFKQYAQAPYSLKYGDSDMGSMNGHCHYQHYAGEWGFDYIGAEIGENIASHQAHLAFTRGAAKQYGKISSMYFSNWYQSTIGTWEEYNSWEGFGYKDGGHSLNLLKRSYMMSYMGGVSSFTFEAGGRLAFIGPEKITSDGYYKLSPYGEAMQELVAFSTKNADVGINYTPIGVVLDYYHGISGYTNLSSSVKSHDKAFGYFKNTAGDNMTWDLFELWYPNGGMFGGKNKQGMPTEDTYQVNTPYGDTHDVLLQNASQKVLNSYPCLLLSGDIKLSTAEAKRYVEYVKQGGTLILNTAYLPYFSSYKSSYKGGTRQDIKDGKGTVIVYGPDYSVENLDSILREQLAKFIPFSFSKDVEYLVNVKNGSLIVTMINNKGVAKDARSEVKIDNSQTINLKLKYTGDLAIQKVNELYYGKSEKVSGNAVDVTLGPGEYKVFEFVFG